MFSDSNVDVYTNVVVPRVDITDTVKECLIKLSIEVQHGRCTQQFTRQAC